MNDLYVNSGIFSQFHTLKIPVRVKKLCEADDMGLVIFGDRENTIRMISLMTKFHVDKGILCPSPQMAGMSKVYEHQKKAYKDAESDDLMRNRVNRPPWLALYYFDQTLAKMFEAVINESFKYWFQSTLTSRALSRANTVLAADPIFRKKMTQFFVPKDWGKLCGGRMVEVEAKDYV